MSQHCCDDEPPASAGPRYRRVLWIALAANLAMFFVELAASAASGSVSLAADAADFAGDAANYGISLAAMAAGGLWTSRAALGKGIAMGIYGAAVLGYAGWRFAAGVPPEPAMMGMVGALALATNLGVAALLYAWREGDANMRAVWLCTRNDAIGNVAVLGAAAGVALTGAQWPDVAVALMMAVLSLRASTQVIRQARNELRHPVGAAV